MEILERRQGGVFVCILSGRLDTNTSPALEAKIFENIQNGEKHLVLEFDGLEYISSAGLRVLLKAVKELKRCDGKMILCSVKDYIKEVLDMAGFTTFIPIAADLDEALTQF